MVKKIVFFIVAGCIPSLYAMEEEAKDPHKALIHFAKYDDDDNYSGRGMFISNEALRQVNTIDEYCDCAGCVGGTGCIIVGSGMTIAACTTCSPLSMFLGTVLSLPWYYGGARLAWRKIAQLMELNSEKKEIFRSMCGTPLRMSDVHQQLLQSNAGNSEHTIKVVLQKARRPKKCGC